MRYQYWIVTFIIFIAACKPDSLVSPVERKIKQSFKIHDDNANGITNLRIQNISIRENARFHYKQNGLLDSLDVFTDTTSAAILLKSMKLKYMDDRIRTFLFDSTGYVCVDVYFNASKQITKIVDTFGLNWGFHFTYINNQISNIKIAFDSTSYFTNFVYDSNNNLTQYIVTDNQSQPLSKVKFTYDYTRVIPQPLDMRFMGLGIRFLYTGGVNVLSLMGLNYGLGNTNRISTREEYNLQTGQNGNYYIISYSTNNNQEITNRKIVVNDTIDFFYEYRY